MEHTKPKLFVKRLNENAILPRLGSNRAAGYDLYSIESKEIASHGKAIVKTGIAI
jgi:dUTP pyrophosphatase